jgi:hypothetical protein
MILARVVTLNAGYNAEQETVINLGWKVGDEFEVVAFSIGQSISTVQINKLGFFNTVFFDFYENSVKIDPYRDSRFNWDL